MLIGLQGLFWISSDGSGYLAQRSMACRSDHDARLAGIVLTWLQVLGRSLVWLVVGVGLLIIYPFTPQEAISDDFAATREMTFVMGIRDLMPLGLRGIAITGMLAALASTVDTHLNWGASYWSNDLYDRLLCQEWLRRRPNHKELVWVARLSNLVILLLALLVMCHLGSIQATWFVSLVFGAGIGGVLMLRWLWDRINLYSEITAIAISLLLAPVLIASVETEWIRLGWMVLASLVGSVAVTFVTPRTENAVLERFCRQVEPFGWWHTKASNHGVWRLGIRLKWTTLMASSLFLFLMGLARVLIPLSWVSPYWGWGFLVAGFALVPWWWPALRSQTF
jgi:Na+/proline symporter